MTKSKFYLIALVTAMLLSVVLASSSSFAQDISYTNQTEATINVPLTQWNELKSNNEKALSLIEASSLPLTEAQSLVMKQQQELIEARNTKDCLKRNAELFDRVERESRERQSNNQKTQDATQPISDGRSGGNHWSGNTSMNER